MLGMSKKAYLIILDGFGLHGSRPDGDAVALAKTPYLDKLFTEYPTALLKTDGQSVGLPDWQTGGSEVGHITISAGRQIDQLLKKINDTIQGKEFFDNPDLKPLFEKAHQNGRIHLMGLCSDGGVHSYLQHLLRLQEMAQNYQIKDIFVHSFLDGRDVGERTASSYLEQITSAGGQLASLSGRYYSMDRDNNWQRTKAAYDTLCNSLIPEQKIGWQEYIQNYYANSEKSDYYLPPALFIKDGQIRPDDVVIFFNFRTDRARQLSRSLAEPDFQEFSAPIQIKLSNFAVFGPYLDDAVQPFCFEDVLIDDTIGQIVSEQGNQQLRISETEKFNHVTFFFSGQRQEPFAGEERILIPSPKCPSYAQQPEMSAVQQTDAAIEAISKKDYQLVVQNYANADLVGHSAELEAAIQAVQVLDECLSRLIPVALKHNYQVFVTADHGNVEEMLTTDGLPNAAHSKNLVPFCWVTNQHQFQILKGDLSDIAPTLLSAIDLPIPKSMTGQNLSEPKK